MIVKHIGADGRTRRTFQDVSSIHQHQGNNIVSVNREMVYTLPPSNSSLPLHTCVSNFEFPLALIYLAPGESLERVDDEPIRS